MEPFALIALALAAVQPAPTATPPPPSPTPVQRGRSALPSYFSADDYPMAALQAGEQGTVDFHLDIGADGRVSRCIVTASSGSASLDETTCAILTERTRYRPAIDARGLPTIGEDSGGISWRLPEEEEDEDPFAPPAVPPAEPASPAAPAPCPGCTPPRVNLTGYFTAGDYPRAAYRAHEEGVVQYRVAVGADGRVIRCDVTRSSGSHALDLATCAIFVARIRYRPARNAAGRPIAGIDSGEIDWHLPRD